MVAFRSGWGSFIQTVPVPEILTAPLAEDMGFLTTLHVDYPPAKLPGVKGLGQITPVSNTEIRGLHKHAAVGRLYQCIKPFYPLQIRPEAGLVQTRIGLRFL